MSWSAALAMLLYAFVILAVLLYVRLTLHRPPPVPRAFLSSKETDDAEEVRVLVVTAHPDDECMFFAPAIVALAATHSIHILCLSTGNYDGLGDIRRNELIASCAILGVPAENCIAIDHPELQDHPTRVWPPAVIASVVAAHVARHSINRILTFDGRGVSGHVNHISVHHGIVSLLQNAQIFHAPSSLQVYTLATVPLVRKYISFLDIIPSVSLRATLVPSANALVESDRLVFVTPWRELYRARHAMTRGHVSQMLWFRYLYILASRYMIINTLERMH